MKKFNLLKYLDPYDKYDKTDFLSDEDKAYFSNHKRSEILGNGSKEAEEILTYLNSVLQYMEDDRYMSNFLFGRSGNKNDIDEIYMMIKKIRKKLMKIERLKKKVKSRKHFSK